MSVSMKYKVSFGKKARRSTPHIGEKISETDSGETPPPPRIARLLALAHYIDRAVESGLLRDFAAAARNLDMTRARMAQVMALLNLSPSIQEMILVGDLQLSEPTLRPLSKISEWKAQEDALKKIQEN